MGKSLWHQWFGRDPTADWPAFQGKVPGLDLEGLGFGPLRLGDPFEAARAVGRPSRMRKLSSGSGGAVLEYDAGGFSLDFRDGKLACIAFVTATGQGERLSPAAVAAQPVVGGLRLTERTTAQDIRAWFGNPTSESGGDGLHWMDYERGGATIAFEFDEGQGLGCVQVYAEGYA